VVGVVEVAGEKQIPCVKDNQKLQGQRQGNGRSNSGMEVGMKIFVATTTSLLHPMCVLVLGGVWL
jgi:hypothetical protein